MNGLNKTKNKPIALYAVAAFAITLVGIALRCVNLHSFYDNDIGYYQSGAILPTVMNIFFIAAVAAAFVFAVIIKKNNAAPDKLARPVYLRIASVIGALLVILSCADVYMFGELSPRKNILVIGMAVAAVALFVTCLKTSDNTSAIASLGVISLFISAILFTYFDSKTQMNSPHKILILLACISAMLFFIGEARSNIGQIKHRSYIFYLFAALFFTGVSSVPSVIMYTSNVFTYPYAKIDLALLGVFLYIAARTISLVFLKPEAVIDNCDSSSADELDETVSNEQDDSSEETAEEQE